MRRRKLLWFLIAWTIGLAGGLCVWSLIGLSRVTRGRFGIQLRGYTLGKITAPREGLLIMINHPSMAEVFIIPFVFFPWFLFNLRYAPISTPDLKNFKQRFWFPLVEAACIVMSRGKKAAYDALGEITNRLREGIVVIYQPEGGRTYRGTAFRSSVSGKTLRTVKSGIGRIVQDTDTVVLPVWAGGGDEVMPNEREGEPFHLSFPRFWRPMTITFGDPVNARDIRGATVEETCRNLEEVMLKTAEM